jgi:putative Ca2+/H+ antiporter (TMEM165/GDT1 family)
MWRTIGRSFSAVFIAELGDKTQLATLALAGDERSKWAVFVGSASALVTTSLIAVLAGSAVARVLPPVWLQRGAGVLFLVLGVWTLWKSTTGKG